MSDGLRAELREGKLSLEPRGKVNGSILYLGRRKNGEELDVASGILPTHAKAHGFPIKVGTYSSFVLFSLSSVVRVCPSPS